MGRNIQILLYVLFFSCPKQQFAQNYSYYFSLLNNGARINVCKQLKNNWHTGISLGEYYDSRELKQVKSGAAYEQYGKPLRYYKFNKINNLYYLNMDIARKQTLFSRFQKPGIRVFAMYTGGLSLFVLKPYRLMVIEHSGGGSTIQDIQYADNPEAYQLHAGILSRGSYLPAVQDLRITPGMHAGVQIGIQYKVGKFYNYLSVGLHADYSMKAQQIVYSNSRNNFNIQTLISIGLAHEKH